MAEVKMEEVVFKCRSKTEYDDGTADVGMEAVQGCEENTKFFKHTPNGFFNLSGINPEFASQFKAGKTYKISIVERKE